MADTSSLDSSLANTPDTEDTVEVSDNILLISYTASFVIPLCHTFLSLFTYSEIGRGW